MKILVCDDAGFIRALVVETLTQKSPDYEVFEAKNGKQAIEMASSLNPKLVFLDLVMPEKNGVEVAKVLKAQDPKIKIIAISTLTPLELEQIYGNQDIFDRYIEKPFAKEQILKALEGI